MKYQKARLLPHPDNPVFMHGKEIWVQAGPPKLETAITYITEEIGEDILFTTSCMGDNGLLMGTRYDCVELLPEFQDDVPITSFAQWCKENGMSGEIYDNQHQ